MHFQPFLKTVKKIFFYDLPPPAPVTMATRPSNLSSDMSELMYDELYYQLKSGYHMIKKPSKNAEKSYIYFLYI